MKPLVDPSAAPPRALAAAAATYAELLAELEARRKASDDLLLRRMLHVREPLNPG